MWAAPWYTSHEGLWFWIEHFYWQASLWKEHVTRPMLMQEKIVLICFSTWKRKSRTSNITELSLVMPSPNIKQSNMRHQQTCEDGAEAWQHRASNSSWLHFKCSRGAEMLQNYVLPRVRHTDVFQQSLALAIWERNKNDLEVKQPRFPPPSPRGC